LENDDRSYTPTDLFEFCVSEPLPLVYDAHHHRVNPDGLSTSVATKLALETWNREPLLHISSPRSGWRGPNPQHHHDYIDVKDFPRCWRGVTATVEVEAKAKELAVVQLMKDLERSKKKRRISPPVRSL
jgi:UV DNA damage endonuclease